MLVALIVLAAIVAVAAAAQLGIPRIAERRVRERLTIGGGSAEVSIAAVPATRLLRNSGDRLIVRGNGLEIGLTGGTERSGLSALDGFDEVDVELVDFRAGPFTIAAFVLERSAGQTYAMATRGSASGAELARMGGELLRGLPGAGVVGAVAGGMPGAPLGRLEVSIEVQLELISEAGGLRVGAGSGSIGGYPAGPAATAIAAAVARRLEIVP